MNILVLNCGSSTVKFQLIATDLDLIAQGADDWRAGLLSVLGVKRSLMSKPREVRSKGPLRHCVIYEQRLTTSRAGPHQKNRAFMKSEALPIFRRWAIAWCTAASASRIR